MSTHRAWLMSWIIVWLYCSDNFAPQCPPIGLDWSHESLFGSTVVTTLTPIVHLQGLTYVTNHCLALLWWPLCPQVSTNRVCLVSPIIVWLCCCDHFAPQCRSTGFNWCHQSLFYSTVVTTLSPSVHPHGLPGVIKHCLTLLQCPLCPPVSIHKDDIISQMSSRFKDFNWQSTTGVFLQLTLHPWATKVHV